MHELSIAMSIIDMASDEAERRGVDRIDAVYLRLGALSGIVPRALMASYEMAIELTPLAGSRLVIEDSPVLIRCEHCGGERPARSARDLACAECGVRSCHIVQGREIEVVALEFSA